MMARANALVDRVSALSPPSAAPAAFAAAPRAQFVAVGFAGGQSGNLDMTSPRSAVWAEVLDSLREEDQPAYVEIDPATNVITELLCPLTVSVEALTPIDLEDAVEVELAISHARHFLRRSNPDFQEMLKTLEAARKKGTQVVVTESSDGREIIDVRPAAKPVAKRKPKPKAKPKTRRRK